MSDELLFHLKYGSGPWNVWRRENPDVPIALDGANLHECHLLGADLTNVRCSGADLAGALHMPPAKAR